MEEAALRKKVRLGSGYDMPLNHRKMYPFYAECEELGCRYQCKLGIFLKLCSANMPGLSSWTESPATSLICLLLNTHRVAWKQEYRMAEARLEVLKLSLPS